MEVYFDNNATTRVLPEVAEAMQPFYTESYGNPSSIHRFGSEVGQKIEQARAQVAGLLGAADPVEVIFTSCGTEGDNAAIRGMLEARPDKRHIITTKVEHSAVLGLCQHLEKKGYRVTWLSVDPDGALDLAELSAALSDDTALVSIMWANNETGVIFPVEKIGALTRAKGIPLHVDAVQAAGKIPMNVSKLPVDLVTISGHKFHAPKGVGALFVRRGITFPPFLIGGHQERNRRAGTENVAGIIGMGLAAETALGRLSKDRVQVTKLRDRLEALLLASCPESRVNGQNQERLPNTSNISFRYLEGES
ncbi:MAG TPA: aminotransferase class V-fold PLP-dependent enzyme, partial [Candidatus Binatia bacterium]|nr:aminotransferase class V-fold PLP-dependent enzyme [Candidatus Binatia bacterium]